MVESDGSEVIVSLPVPRRHLPAMVKALAREMETDSGEQELGGGGYAEYPLLKWTADEIARLKREVRNPTVKAVLELTAGRPDEQVTFAEVLAAVGRSADEAKASLSAFTKFVKTRFGRRNWPFIWEKDPDGRSAYRMTKEIADLWNAS